MSNYTFGSDIPMGFGMALAQNAQAMQVFAAMTQPQRQQILDGVKSIRSKDEMRQYVAKLVEKP